MFVIKLSLTFLFIRLADCFELYPESLTNWGSSYSPEQNTYGDKTSLHPRGSNDLNNLNEPGVVEGNQDSKNDFYVNARTNYKATMERQFRYNKSSEFYYDNGKSNRIELTCQQNYADKDRNLTLEWKDNNGFVIPVNNGYGSIALRLTVNPDAEDVDSKYTCKAYKPKMESISIKLVANPTPHQKESTQEEVPWGIKKGARVVSNATCNYTMVHFPNGSSSLFNKNDLIINTFEETYIGTIVYCFKHFFSNASEGFKKIPTYERTKSKTVLYLDEEKTTTTESHHSMKGNISPGNAIPIGAESVKASDTILGWTLGSIILILLAVIIVMWYRKTKRQQLLDNSTHYVIYAEIEEITQNPPPLPPPRTEPPYAQIAGTLMPAEPNLIENDQTPLYCSIKEL